MSSNKGGAPKGNRNAAKGKAWANALQRALAQYESDGVVRGEALRAIADKCIEQALEGDKDARKEIGDRLDGRPAQTITGEDGGPIRTDTHWTVELVRAASRDT